MKITGSPATSVPVAAAPAEASQIEAATPPGAQASTPLQSAGLQKAQAALAGMAEIDQGRVDALRDAIARGELPFDASKLAGLIERYHGGKP